MQPVTHNNELMVINCPDGMIFGENKCDFTLIFSNFEEITLLTYK